MTDKIRCILVDDDKVDLLTTSVFLESYPFIEIAGRYTSPLKALAASAENPPDVLFIDIDMPDLNGFELRKKLMGIPACVFVTSFPDYALESFELNTLDYLLKPFTHDRFARTVSRIQEYMEVRRKADKLSHALTADTVFIKEGTRQVKLNFHEIIYLEALNNYTSVVTSGRKYTVLSTLRQLMEQKPFHQFVRIHRSFAVQKHYIDNIARNQVVIGDVVLPIGRSFKDSLESLLRKPD